MKKLPLLFIILIATSTMFSQTYSKYVCITLSSGIQRCGYILNDDGREVTIDSQSLGKIIIPKTDIISMTESTEGTVGENSGQAALLDRVSNTERNIQPSRYFFAPSAFSLRKNEGYGTFALLTGGNISYGITESSMLGMSATYLGAGINFKKSLKVNEKTHASFGGMFQIGWADTSPIFFPFANLTKGTETKNITFGFGYLSQLGSSWNDPIHSPMINVSGTTKINNKLSLISENYYFFNPEFFPVNTVLSIGMRYYGSQKNRLTDFAFMMFVEEDGNIIPAPWFSWTWPF